MNSSRPKDISCLDVEIINRQSADVDTRPLVEIVRRIVADAGYTHGEISMAIVDDPTIHQLNRQYLQHDYSTDVLSFVFEAIDSHLEGEIIVSAETARRNSVEYNQTLQNEIMLYAIHGALHLVGYEDSTAQGSDRMRKAEQQYLRGG